MSERPNLVPTINFSSIKGKVLPDSALEKKFSKNVRSFHATGVSVVVHPHNPFVPCAHLNVRFFALKNKNGSNTWWYGGGYDLTPYFPYKEDIKLWHNGTHSFLTNDTGYFLLNNLDNNDILLRTVRDCYLQPASGENGVIAKANGAAELYYDDSKKFETSSGKPSFFIGIFCIISFFWLSFNLSVIFVCIKPGAIIFTLIFLLATSNAIDLYIDIKADLDAV